MTTEDQRGDVVSLRKNCQAFFDRWKKKYCQIKELNNKFADDFKGLFHYGACSIDKLVYQSNGVMGICADFIAYRRDLPNRLSFIGENLKTLETILKPEHYNEQNMPAASSLNKIIGLKNKYFWKDFNSLQNIIYLEADICVDNIESLLKETIRLKKSSSYYNDLSRINYDYRIAPKDMSEEMVHSYLTSDKSLKELSKDLELKYGMYVSASTISVKARKYLCNQGLEFKNRKEARKHYSEKHL